jgi:hypothetical protein
MATSAPPSGNGHLPLQRVARRLEAWRATRSAGQRIPERFWSAAEKLAAVHGVSRTATTLKLSYYDLRRRVSDDRADGGPAGPRPAFVEVSAPRLTGVEPGDSLELVKSSGARLTLRVAGAKPRDYVGLVQMFLRYGS